MISHEYEGIRLEIIYEIVIKDIDALKKGITCKKCIDNNQFSHFVNSIED